MKEDDREQTIRRILVAIDASPHSLAALRAAAELAASLDAELLGLYVEDINLLRLSDLPVARQLFYFSAAPEQLDREKIEQQLRSQARQARRALERAAHQARLRWSFRVSQGMIAAELLAAALETDLLILGKSGWSGRRRLGSTARVVITQAPRQAMLLQRGARLGQPVGVVYDGSDVSRRALATARHLMRSQESYLMVVIRAKNPDEARALQSEVSQWARRFNLEIRFRWLVNENGPALHEVIVAEGCGALVLPVDGETFQEDDLVELLSETKCPALLVR